MLNCEFRRLINKKIKPIKSIESPKLGYMTQNSRFFSIVIPTYNRPERLAKCLGAIAKLDYPRDRFEVIVVDDGSDTPLDLIVRPFQEQLSLTLIRQPNGGPAKARNTGVANAKGQFLTFTDDDCTPDSNWLTALEKRLFKQLQCSFRWKNH